MKVSVVIPLYNKERHVRRAMVSVLGQTCGDFEVIIVDDGSTDRSVAMVQMVKDSRIRLLSQANRGVSAARNRGIAAARADQVAFLDADDEWLPCFLETVLRLRERYPMAGMYGTAYQSCREGVSWRPTFRGCVDDPDGGLLPDYFRAYVFGPPMHPSAVMVPKGVFEEVGGFPEGVKRGEDDETFARIALRYRVAWSPIVGSIYHLSADNRACLEPNPAPDLAFAKTLEEFLQQGRDEVVSCASVEKCLVHTRLRRAIGLCQQGDKPTARSLLHRTSRSRFCRAAWWRLRLLLLVPRWLLGSAIRCRRSLRSARRRASRK